MPRGGRPPRSWKREKSMSGWPSGAMPSESYERLRSRFPDDPHIPEANSRLITVRKRESARGHSAG